MPATNVAIIGCGGIAALSHVPALWRNPDDLTIRYLCDPDRSRAEALRLRCRIPPSAIADVDTVLADDEVAGVIIAAWPASHLRLALAAIAAGKHVMVQKPVAFTAADGATLVAAATASDRNVLTLPLVEFVPGVQELAGLLAGSALGEISFVRVRVSIPGPVDYHRDVRRFFHEPVDDPGSIFDPAYALGMGCSADMGPYALSLVHHLFGPAELVGVRKSAPALEHMFLLSLILPDSGALCSVELGWSQYPSGEMCVVMGSRGTATVSMTGQLTLNPSEPDGAGATAPFRPGAVLPADPAAAQDRWLDAIRAGKSRAFDRSVLAASWTAGILEQIRDR
ncbi:Gfo/Idh/MocA family protein [Actinoplanes sp. L3-i22]|uniref:Gfo/Idh/MocA family protein n=1 Tax=Actinoplanes sp. L3-i22 TaxID=2836373 RepID=UPI001C76DE1F|nr:Gfo/Idh/MocA family oxidoreductase [Actinoplanes sp. L3-i22]BCY11305.1 hypothetical protein L3i22_063930 [Actinoplanes sp. L3-i22]